MPLITSVTSVIQVIPRVRYLNGIIENVLSFITTEAAFPGAALSMEEFLQAFLATYAPQRRDVAPENAVLEEVRIQELVADAAPTAKYIVTNAFIETVTGDTEGELPESTIPGSVSCVLTLQTNQIGRRNRGRIYHAPFAPVQIVGGRLNELQVNGVIEVYAALAAGILVGEGVDETLYQLCVFSRREAQLAGGADPLRDHANIVENVRLNRALRTQRRRNVGVGA